MSDRQQYRAFPGLVQCSAGRREALLSRPDGSALWLDARLAKMLALCDVPRSRDDHVSALAAPADQHRAAQAGIDALIELGLLVPVDALVARLRGEPTVSDSGPIEVVCVPTRRPKLLSRLRDSLSRVSDVEVVVDDAPAEDLARDVARRSGVSEELCSWALAGPPISTGASRNALMLRTRGRLSLQLDDDIVCEMAASPERCDGIGFVAQGSHRQIGFDVLPLAPRDPCAVSELLLGKSVRGLLRAKSVDVAGLSGSMLRRLEERDAVVVATQLGLMGDAATRSLDHYLWLGAPSRQRLVRSEAIYRRAMRTRQQWRVAPRLSLSQSGACMSYALGLDGRHALPPFAPRGRGSDGVFGVAVRATLRHGFFGYLPHVIAHRRGDQPSSASRTSLNDVLRVAIADSGIAAPHHDPHDNMRALGAALQRVPIDRVALSLRAATIRRMAALERLLDDEREKYPWWARDAEAWLAAQKVALLEPVPDEATPYIRRYGELLNAWPKMLECGLLR